MKKTYLLLALFSIAAQARDSYVRGYTRKDGTEVQGHYRSKANSTDADNYSTRGNTNPYTGKSGTVDRSDNDSPFKSDRKTSSWLSNDNDD